VKSKLPEAILSIYIKKNLTEQGKFCFIDRKPSFIANMTPAKWFKNFAGYAIAKQILTKLPRGTRIIYKRNDLNTHYITNKTGFYRKGVAINYGDHQQIVLPIKEWKWFKGKPKEKYNLSKMVLSKWKKKGEKRHLIEDYTIPLDIKARLKEVYRRRFLTT